VAQGTRILVWDAPLRIFHWLFAATFAGAFVTAEADGFRALHLAFGYAFAALLAFRIVWATVGTRHARWAALVHGPAAVLRYLRSLLSRSPEPFAGHNPAGSWAIVALLTLGAIVAATGYLALPDTTHWLEEVHEGAANAMLALVVVHIAGVVVGSLAHRENLPLAMLTGYKRGRPDEGIAHARWGTAAALAVGVAVLVTTILPELATSAAAERQAAHAGRHAGGHDRHVRHADDD
jgi:cytochrome b